MDRVALAIKDPGTSEYLRALDEKAKRDAVLNVVGLLNPFKPGFGLVGNLGRTAGRGGLATEVGAGRGALGPALRGVEEVAIVPGLTNGMRGATAAEIDAALAKGADVAPQSGGTGNSSNPVVGAQDAPGTAGGKLVEPVIDVKVAADQVDKNLPLKPPSARHYADKVKQNTTSKEINTVVDRSVVDISSDVNLINSNQSQKIGNLYMVNGRTYGFHDKILYPISGPGLYPLDRGGKALGVLNQFGDTPQASMIMKNMGVSPETKAAALEVFKVINK